MKQRQSIRTTYYSVLIFVSTVIIILSISLINSKYESISHLHKTRETVEEVILLFDAVRNFGFERGRVNVVFNYKGNIADMDHNISFFTAKRAEGEKYISAVLDYISKSPEYKELPEVGRLTALRQKVGEYRKVMESELSKPYSQRVRTVSRHWFSLMSSYIESVTDLALRIGSLTGDMGAKGRAYLDCLGCSVLLRDNAGPVCSYMGAAILSPKSFDHELYEELIVRQAKAKDIMKRLTYSADNTDDPDIIGALRTIKKVYFSELNDMNLMTMSALRSGSKNFPYTQREYTTKAVASLEVIADLAHIAKVKIITFLNTSIKQQYVLLTGYILLLLVIFFYLIYVARVLMTNIYIPIENLIGNLKSLAGGNTNIEIMAKKHNDEVGDLIDAVNAFRDTQIKLSDINKNLEDIVVSKTRQIGAERDKLQVIIDSVPVIILIKDLESNLTMGNKAAAKRFGVAQSKLMELTSEELQPGIDPDTFYNEDAKVIETGQGLFGIIRHHKGPDGKDNVFKVSKVPLKDLYGRVSGILVLAVDITAEMEAEEEKRQSYETQVQQAKMAELGNMLGVIIHQWKQPLNIIALITQNLQDCEEDEAGLMKYPADEMQEDLKHLLNSTLFMSETCNDFINYFKPAKGKESFKPCEIVRELYTLFKSNFTSAGIEFDFKEHKCFEIYGVVNEFKQVVLNIMNNARDALEKVKDNRKVTVEFGETEDSYCIMISDNAGGIPEDLLPDKIFEQYLTTKGSGGSGIGLYISRQIIEHSFDGKLTAENSEEGAVFRIIFGK